MGIYYPEKLQGQLYYPGDRVVFRDIRPDSVMGRYVHSGDAGTVVYYWREIYSYTVEVDILRHEMGLRISARHWSLQPET